MFTLPSTPPSTPNQPALSWIGCFFLMAAVLGAGGCNSTEIIDRPVHVAGGKVIGIPFGPNGPLPGRANGYEVAFAAIGPGATDKDDVYRFVVKIPPGTVPESIKIDDISDDEPYTLVDDLHPWLDSGFWHFETLPIKNDDPRVAWILTVSPSLRVYRFTIIDNGGRRSLLYQLMSYPNAFKYLIRRKWGEKY